MLSKVNFVQVTYTVPLTGSAAIHSLSLNTSVGTGVPAAVTPSNCRMAGSPQVSPPSCETDTARPLACWEPSVGMTRLNTRLA